MKNLTGLLFLFFSISLHAQNISGIYSGKLVNDSTHKEQQYELALSEYRGKITGYSYTTFIVNDSFYYSVKRVKAVRNGNVLEVEDVKMLANNFPQAPDKGVRQVMRIPLNTQDSITELKGTWKTTQTRVFYSIGGAMDMRRESDSSRLALVNHLYDIGEWQKPKLQEQEALAAAKPEKQASKEQPVAQKPAPETPLAKAPKAKEAKANTTTTSAPVLAYHERKEAKTQHISTSSDSLVLSFYDNGMVDGDTISVYLNGANIISKVKLTAAAAKQTIYLNAATEVYKLVLVAENLGTIPPNTGLLVIQDGSNRYQVHFTADLMTNAAIELRRKPVKN